MLGWKSSRSHFVGGGGEAEDESRVASGSGEVFAAKDTNELANRSVHVGDVLLDEDLDDEGVELGDFAALPS